MKILVLSNLYPPDVIGGYELGCKQVVDALRVRGHEVLVLTTAPRTPAPSVEHVVRDLQLSEIWNNYLFEHSRPVTAHLLQVQSALVNAINVHALARVVEGFRPDVAYIWNLMGVGGVGLMAAVQHFQVPWLWHLMDDVPLGLCHLGGRYSEPLLREINRQLDGRFLACSRQLADEIEGGGIKLDPNLSIVPNWVVGPRPEPRTRAYRAGSGQLLKVMVAGQINRSKGVDLLIQAAAIVRDSGFEGFVIDLYGEVNDSSFQAQTKARGLDRFVRFLGPRPQIELPQLYAEHDLFAFPTWAREPFAFAPLEAAWRGCVPLMSQQCGNAEWFVGGVHCLKADRTAEAFADAMISVLNGTTDLGPISRRASTVVGRDFHLDVLAPRIERALVRASSAPKRPGGTAAEAYRMALLAEKLSKVLIQEMVSAA